MKEYSLDNTQSIIYGLDKYFFELINLINKNSFPKNLMLSGNKGQGKFVLVHHLLGYFFNKKNYNLENKQILDNNEIYQNLKNNYDPNIIYFDCKSKNAKIEEIRKLRDNIQKTSINNKKRFIIFDDIDCLNKNCVNALLKTLEEPTETNHYILINNQTFKILDTLKSRSIEINVLLNKNEKINIIKNLINEYNIDVKIDFENAVVTPGNFIFYNQITIDNNINLNDDLIVNIDKLLKLYKSKKETTYLNFVIFLTSQYFYEKSKDISNINNYNFKRFNIIKKIYDTNNLNLNYTNLITEIENSL